MVRWCCVRCDVRWSARGVVPCWVCGGVEGVETALAYVVRRREVLDDVGVVL